MNQESKKELFSGRHGEPFEDARTSDGTVLVAVTRSCRPDVRHDLARYPAAWIVRLFNQFRPHPVPRPPPRYHFLRYFMEEEYGPGQECATRLVASGCAVIWISLPGEEIRSMAGAVPIIDTREGRRTGPGDPCWCPTLSMSTTAPVDVRIKDQMKQRCGLSPQPDHNTGPAPRPHPAGSHQDRKNPVQNSRR